MLKRIISLVLVLVMVISMLPARAVAAGYQTALDRAADFGGVLESILEQSAENMTVPTEAVSAPEETSQQIVPEALPEPEPEIILTDTEGDYTYTVSSDNTATITGYSGTDTELVIPDTLGGYPVTGIGESAFSNNTKVTFIRLPANLVTLGGYAFTGCNSLKEVLIPKTLKTATLASGTYCGPFHNSGIRKAILEEGITTIPENLFWNAAQLEEVVIPDSVTAKELLPTQI